MIKTLNFIFNHPCNKNNRIRSILRYFIWQFSRLIGVNQKIIQFTSKTRLIVNRGIASSTGNYYCGLMEFIDMAFLLHVLNKNDLFIDVGANIGSYTVLASGEIGARSICFEPVNKTFEMLSKNLELNSIETLVEKRKIGIGEINGTLRITNNQDSTNHIINNENFGEKIDVERLDNFYEKINRPTLLKIDVEGYELNVLKGASKILKNSEVLAIIIEINGLSKKFNIEEKLIHDQLVEHGFFPVDYDPYKRIVTKTKSFNDLNTIYVRDLRLINDKVKNNSICKIGTLNFSI